jgi:hypothetical protein
MEKLWKKGRNCALPSARSILYEFPSPGQWWVGLSSFKIEKLLEAMKSLSMLPVVLGSEQKERSGEWAFRSPRRSEGPLIWLMKSRSEGEGGKLGGK